MPMDTPVGNWWLAALVFFALNGGFLFWALRVYRRRDRLLQELLAERTRELEEAHEQLQRTQRLVAVGELARTFARELRSPLAAIRNTAYLLRLKWPSGDDEAREHLDLIESEIEHCNRLIGELLDRARGD